MINLFLMLALVSPAMAHDIWISERGLRSKVTGELCCGLGDCFEIPSDMVVLEGSEYVTRREFKGETYIWERIPYFEAQPSPDGKFWRCKRHNGSRRCFFAPLPIM